LWLKLGGGFEIRPGDDRIGGDEAAGERDDFEEGFATVDLEDARVLRALRTETRWGWKSATAATSGSFETGMRRWRGFELFAGEAGGGDADGNEEDDIDAGGDREAASVPEISSKLRTRMVSW